MSNLVFKQEDQILTTSRKIASNFNKRHGHVLRDIDNMIKNRYIKPTDVKLSSYVQEFNKQTYREYLFNNNASKKIKTYYSMTKKYNKSNSLYILSHKGFDGYYKIGITHCINSRLSSYNTASPLGVEVVFLKDCFDAKKTELKVHKSLSHRRKNGEWFNLNETELKKVINYINEGVEVNERIGIQ